jgi:histone acetyltransferase (RNA polymerase elongator complex component)
LEIALDSLKENSIHSEIAFFGGSFTAIERGYMVSLLEAAQQYIENGFLNGGIRISTRPDFIDDEVLTLLKKYGVRAIELGAQSMDDGVLSLNKRGHTADDVRKAAKLIKEYGFESQMEQDQSSCRI